MGEICALLRVRKIQTTAYHPACNGQVERSHQTFITMITHFVYKDQRITPHSSTSETPLFMVHGREINRPFDDIVKPKRIHYALEDNYEKKLLLRLPESFEVVRENLRRAADMREYQFNQKAKDVNVEVGDNVSGVGMTDTLIFRERREAGRNHEPRYAHSPARRIPEARPGMRYVIRFRQLEKLVVLTSSNTGKARRRACRSIAISWRPAKYCARDAR
ncbi:hypothetical protein PR048_011087 [Dryococelus australis]|uniref:Integrase catalytic domain-containing protein n=1 Tax=Dryococelus australis TaxID=614101 RepID=A0ABQ9HKM6_9NEOP|nr:hypothetical protein PR048_011087 [Dryococelus australis]